jgi:hypothetical protein
MMRRLRHWTRQEAAFVPAPYVDRLILRLNALLVDGVHDWQVRAAGVGKHHTIDISTPVNSRCKVRQSHLNMAASGGRLALQLSWHVVWGTSGYLCPHRFPDISLFALG